MKKSLILLGLAFSNLLLFSQENLIPNPIFKDVSKKVKSEGQIDLAAPWISPTLAPADLYVSDTKNSLIGVPDNGYGEEKAMEGDNYAGFVAYGYKGKESRSYLQAKLTSKLEAGKEYCVTFHVSLADLSKYATNYLGAYISKDAVSANNTDPMLFEAQIVSKKLTVYEKQFYWVPVCGKFKASGGEEYVTIGNFTPDEKLNLSKVKRPRGFTSPQTYDAYYYIDNISLVEIGEKDKCDCDAVPGLENAETVSRNFNSDSKSSTSKTKIINSYGTASGSNNTSNLIDENTKELIVSFDPKSFSIIGDATKMLDNLVVMLKNEPTTKVLVEGYFDASEKEIEKLDAKRVMSVYKYIVSKGIKADLIKRSMEGQGTSEDLLKNSIVKITLLKEELSEE
ncbi:OmpA family protein [Vicingus serpentipes]|jgi:OmpA-OmpF porin, OOP family|uniref:OmpA family protein n=1 Tax=Vicingus serpentipes TaxID=1926625 RepID=A0A5C6RSF3_9FLAO|nr:OmpA family protein [Vicingus serpentipes]TXB65193.1 OmpA family protein [Vicingus serpentipes]